MEGADVDAIQHTQRVVGQEQLRTALVTSLMSSGHILLESVPGLAKTTAAQTLASAVSGSFRRIQCTPDLMPNDIVGTQILNSSTGEMTTQLGPVHANIVLLDEINRSSAKTQSAMLEAMQERQTSIGGQVFKVPEPFLVLATQNPIEQEGTYPLPEAQLDRFMVKDVLDYPTPDQEAEIIRRLDAGVFEEAVRAVISLDDVRTLQRSAAAVHLERSIVGYITHLVAATRDPRRWLPPELARYVEVGASPRASIAFTNASRALAMVRGRNYVIPEDVKDLAVRILRHRILLNFEAVAENIPVETALAQGATHVLVLRTKAPSLDLSRDKAVEKRLVARWMSRHAPGASAAWTRRRPSPSAASGSPRRWRAPASPRGARWSG